MLSSPRLLRFSSQVPLNRRDAEDAEVAQRLETEPARDFTNRVLCSFCGKVRACNSRPINNDEALSS